MNAPSRSLVDEGCIDPVKVWFGLLVLIAQPGTSNASASHINANRDDFFMSSFSSILCI